MATSPQQIGSSNLSRKEVLERALRLHRGGALCEQRFGNIPSLWGEVFSWVVMTWIMLGTGWFLAQKLGWAVGLPWLGATAIALIPALVIVVLAHEPTASALQRYRGGARNRHVVPGPPVQLAASRLRANAAPLLEEVGDALVLAAVA